MMMSKNVDNESSRQREEGRYRYYEGPYCLQRRFLQRRRSVMLLH
jgi:hypothetical protein